MTIDGTDARIQQAALKFATAGVSILPCHSTDADGRCTCGKPDCSSAGKHPRTAGGLKDASNDLEIVRGWWARWPDANIGFPTGRINGHIVIDIDGPDGEASLAAMGLAMPETRQASTGRGRHLYFTYAGTDVKNSAGRIGKGVDVRGEGGYAIIAPSRHRSGSRYTWTNAVNPAPLPEWLRVRCVAPDPKPTAAARPIIATSSDAHGVLVRRARIYVAAAEGIGEGGRNGACFRLAGHLASFIGEGGEAMAEGEIVDLLADFSRRCTPPLPEHELVTAVRSALQNGTAREPKPPKQSLSRRARTAMACALEDCNV